MVKIFYEMKYKRIRDYGLLSVGEIDGYEFKIVSLGTHPCAYVKLPTTHFCFNFLSDYIPIDVHGGLTYSANENDGFRIGWDYAHCGDYTSFGFLSTDKKWTVDEILAHVQNVIAKLKTIDNITNSNLFKNAV